MRMILMMKIRTEGWGWRVAGEKQELMEASLVAVDMRIVLDHDQRTGIGGWVRIWTFGGNGASLTNVH